MINIFKYFKANSKLKRQLNDANNRIFNLNNKSLKEKKSHNKAITNLNGRVSSQSVHIKSLNKAISKMQRREKQLTKDKEDLKQRIFGKKPKNKVIPFKLTDSMLLRGVGNV